MDRSMVMRIEEGEADYELQLTPRIKFNLEITGFPESGISSDSIENALLTVSNANGFFCGVNAELSRDDINIQFKPRKSRCSENPPPLLLKGKGTMFYRNLNFVGHLNTVKQLYLHEDQLHIRLRKVRNFIKDILSGARQSIDRDGPGGGSGYGDIYHWAIVPAGEDADEMMNTLPANLSKPPAVVVKGLPCKWFSDPSNPSLPSKERVLHLFKQLGDNVELHTSVNNSHSGYFEITLQYATLEECHDALKQLCSFSLQKVEGGSSPWKPENAEYEVSWKDFAWNDTFDSLSETERLLKTGQPLDHSGSTSKSDCASQIEALQNQLEQLQENLRILKLSHDGEKSKGG